MMTRHESSIRLTHKATGISVTLNTTRMRPPNRADYAVARRWLLSKVHRPVEPERPVRTYMLSPASVASIRQDGRRLVAGSEAVSDAICRGKIDRMILESRQPKD